MRLDGFTFYVTSGANDVQVTPVVEDLVFSEEYDDDLNIYVRTLETEMVFKGTDYALFYDNWESLGTCESLPFKVQLDGSQYYTGYLRMGSAKTEWDLDRCVMRATIDPSGSWQCLRDNWDAEINILAGTTKVQIAQAAGELQCNWCIETSYPVVFSQDDWAVASSGGWTVIENRISNVIPEGYGGFPPSSDPYYEVENWESTANLQTKYCRLFWPTSGGTPPGSGWVAVAGGYGKALTRTLDESEYDDEPFPDYYIQEIYTTDEITSGGTVARLYNGVTLADVFDTFFPAACGGPTIKSDFFNINPSGDAPANSPYTFSAANLENIVIFQKSDVKRPTATQAATVGTWTLKDIFSTLKEHFNVQWRFQNGNFRIEHVSYFTTTSGLNLTSGSNAQLITGFNRYSYDNSKMADQERWQFMENTSPAFQGAPLTYGSCLDYSTADEIVRDLGRVNNDVEYIQANTDQIDDDGFVLVNAYATSGGDYYINTFFVPTWGQYKNGHMAIPSLLSAYHTYERLLPTGTLNGSVVAFDTWERRKKQTEVTIKMSRADYKAFDAGQLIKTGLGWGEVESAEYSAAACALTLTLKHT